MITADAAPGPGSARMQWLSYSVFNVSNDSPCGVNRLQTALRWKWLPATEIPEPSWAFRPPVHPSLILSGMNFAVAQLGSGDYLIILVAIMAVVHAGSAGVIVVIADGRQGC
jgi:hypothetical protein